MPVLVYTLALAGALCSASATILIRQGLRDSDAYTGFWMNVLVGTVGLWGAILLIAPGETLQVAALPFFILSGLLGTVAGRFLRFVGIDRVGASVAAAIHNLHPFMATTLAIVFLGERVTWPILAGTMILVLGTILLSTSGRYVGFRPVHLVYPFLSTSCFGLVAIIRKLGLQHTGPWFGLAINVTAALLAFTVFLVLSGKHQAMVCKGRSLWYFVAAGVAENTGVLLTLMALGLGTVSVVAPLAGTAPLFVLPMTWLFLHGIETLSRRIVLGVLLIVLGVYCLTL
jgi:uncharacterized membrane protein